MTQELVVLVNEKNEEIGTMPKKLVHSANTPLHRAFSCYLFNIDGEFLLTQRAFDKLTFPGIWTNSCCGHPGPGEKTEDAIARRVQNELGLVAQELQVVLPDFRYRCEMNGIFENEICPVYVGTVSDEPKVNPSEVADYKWILWDAFVKLVKKNPREYSYWCVMQVKELEKISDLLPIKK